MHRSLSLAARSELRLPQFMTPSNQSIELTCPIARKSSSPVLATRPPTTKRPSSSSPRCRPLGLQYYSLRFVDVGSGVKNVMKLTKSEITKLRHLEDEYGMNVASIGSPIGKVKLRDVDDGTKNQFVPFDKISRKGSQPRLRAGPRLRDQADPRLFVLPAQGRRPARARRPGRRPARPDRRDLPPQRSDVRPGNRGQPRRPNGRTDGRAAPPRESPGPGHDLRRRQHRQPGLHARGNLRSNTWR